MSKLTAELRQVVEDRAMGRCEFCGIEGRTAVGRVTATLLRMNAPNRRALR